MSEEGGFGVKLAERFFGLIILIVSVLMLYYTLTSLQGLGSATGLLVFINVILIVLGLFLLTAKTE